MGSVAHSARPAEAAPPTQRGPRTGVPRRIQVLDRALLALELLADAPNGFGVTELGRRLGVDKSTAHRLLTTLLHRGFVRVEPRTQRYVLGLRLVGLGAAAWRGVDLADVARPVLEKLRDETREAAHLAVLSEGEVLFLGKASVLGALTVNVGVGTRAPAHCTSLGKALLAWLDEADVDRVVAERGLPRFTARTITDPDDLKRHLRQVRQRGWALDDEERDVGLRCVATPVRDTGGQVVAAIGISGPAARITLDRVEALAAQVTAAAAAVSEALGYRESGVTAAAGSPLAAG